MSRKLLLVLVLVTTVGLSLGGRVQASPSPFTVDSTGDAPDSNTADGICDDGTGACTLRAAIEQANAAPGTDTIAFNIPGAGPHTVQPVSALPTVTDAVIIDGYTQPGASPNTNPPGLGTNAALKIEVDGSEAGPDAGGLNIIAGNSTVRGLVLNRFAGDAIELRTGGGNVVEGNFLGTDVAGTTFLSNLGDGVLIEDSPANSIGGTAVGARNVISGFSLRGVEITGSGAASNLVQGNLIGTGITGTEFGLPNNAGVRIIDGSYNSIGGTTAEARNVISGNGLYGVEISGTSATGNLVQGNFIGPDVTGAGSTINAGDGVRIIDAPNNTVGGTTNGARNVISDNGGYAVVIQGSSASGNRLEGNFIGPDGSGHVMLGNRNGVSIDGAPNNAIGGTTAGAGNVISGSWEGDGVLISGRDAAGNRVQGNLIGTDVTGTSAASNSDSGVTIVDAPRNAIGGAEPGAGNVISGNATFDVDIWGSDATENLVRGNLIGTDITGTLPLGSAWAVRIGNAPNNTIGGTMPGARNVISANDLAVTIVGSGATGNRLEGNFIGTDASGTAAVPNLAGVFVSGGASGNTIGGTVAGAGNVISGNRSDGVTIGDDYDGAGTAGNQVQGNYIGTTAGGTGPLGNSRYGLFVGSSAHDNTIGGTTSGAANVIAFNGGTGLVVEFGIRNAILSNSVFANAGLGIDLGKDGVTLNDAGDSDSGANNLQNFPVLTSAAVTGGNTTIGGSLNSTPNTTFGLEFFSNTACDPSGYGEGEDFLGSTVVTTSDSGDASFAVTFPIAAPTGQFITATATDPNDNTSEFSRCAVVETDSDADGCVDSDEAAGAAWPKPGSTGAFDPLAWYDFFDVPVPVKPDPMPNGVRNRAVNLLDVLAVLKYVPSPPPGGTLDTANVNGVAYNAIKGSCDWNGDTVPDKEGMCYDRTLSPAPNPPWDAGPPDGAITLLDVIAALRQYGLDCSRAP